MSSPQLTNQGDGPLPDLTSGAMWLATSAAGLAALAMPGAVRSHLALVLGWRRSRPPGAASRCGWA